MTGATELLHLTHQDLAEFSAVVLEVDRVTAEMAQRAPQGAAWAVRLDRTAFYPGGGGQPPDRGRLEDLEVLGADLAPRDPAVVLHFLAAQTDGSPGLVPGQTIKAQVDWQRRFDLMQQHTGQHILSAVALREWSAPTTGFHLSGETATVDLAFAPHCLADAKTLGDLIAQLEHLACAEVFADRRVDVEFVDPGAELAAQTSDRTKLRVRDRGPAPKAAAEWRVVDVAGLDRSPCGGTHVARTGQVGLVTIQRWDKIRDSLRLEFACGYRALARAARRRDELRRLGAAFSSPEEDAVELALRSLTDATARQRQLRTMRAELLRLRALEMAAGAERLPGGGRLVALILADHTPEDLKLLANSLCLADAGMVALLASSGDPPRLVFARGERQTAIDAGKLLGQVINLIGGKGGGTAQMAQGGGGDPERLAPALQAAAEVVRGSLKGER